MLQILSKPTNRMVGLNCSQRRCRFWKCPKKNKNVNEPPQDPLEHFGKFAAAQIIEKLKSCHVVYMKSITHVLFSNLTVEVEVRELYD